MPGLTRWRPTAPRVGGGEPDEPPKNPPEKPGAQRRAAIKQAGGVKRLVQMLEDRSFPGIAQRMWKMVAGVMGIVSGADAEGAASGAESGKEPLAPCPTVSETAAAALAEPCEWLTEANAPGEDVPGAADVREALKSVPPGCPRWACAPFRAYARHGTRASPRTRSTSRPRRRMLLACSRSAASRRASRSTAATSTTRAGRARTSDDYPSLSKETVVAGTYLRVMLDELRGPGRWFVDLETLVAGDSPPAPPPAPASRSPTQITESLYSGGCTGTPTIATKGTSRRRAACSRRRRSARSRCAASRRRSSPRVPKFQYSSDLA